MLVLPNCSNIRWRDVRKTLDDNKLCFVSGHNLTIMNSLTTTVCPFFPRSLHHSSQICRAGVGAPVVGDLDGEYRHDSRKNILEWSLPVIDENNKSGSMEFSIAGRPNDFFPLNVSFVSKRNYSNILVSRSVYGVIVILITFNKSWKNKSIPCYYRWPKWPM